MIKFLGNKLKEIEKLYKKAKINPCANESYELLKAETFDILKEYLLPPYLIDSGSYLHPYIATPGHISTVKWHQDGFLNNEIGMVISSYPNPTHVLDCDKQQTAYIMEKFPGKASDRRDNFIKKGIAEGRYKLLVPNPGDIYFLSTEVLHRTNPEHINSKHHMVVRVRPHAVKGITND